ncbi:unnamed protein product [Prunus armeniaca]|uniref:25S rRNA (uridine-N(3))-methyltransferase BMT5-like domain-containing protein n=1 Tax=Prunus armeniaca TaxID=36596 RepID=A0A6J5X4T1_PRUAR|nr:unnamed protein product [Prunus armeniaca]
MEVFSFEKKIKHYSSYQKILLAGEGDFSFSVCLARAFGLAVNMVATSLDSRESLMLNYSKAMSNVKELEARGCKVLHEVDVHSMSQHPFLIRVRFDRIIYNFPHAGFFSSERNRLQIWFHQDLVRGFLKNACEMLTAIGEIHVTHKTTFPFTEWKIVELAKEVGLYLVDEEQFSLLDYPGYENKRGAGMCDKTFHVGMCSTFKFAKLLYSSTTSWSGCSGINGPHMQRLHQNFVMGYLNSSSEMHRASYPFSDREMEKLTKEVGLFLVKEEEFSPWDCSCAASSFHPGTLTISLWSVDIVDMACTHLESLERKKPKHGHKNLRPP